jgi:hypothetical protein
MKRMKKAYLIALRKLAYDCKRMSLYYWVEEELDSLRTVCILPMWYYRCLYQVCVWMVEIREFRQIADRMIHTIPYHVRFELA